MGVFAARIGYKIAAHGPMGTDRVDQFKNGVVVER